MFFQEKMKIFFWNEKRLRSAIFPLHRQTDDAGFSSTVGSTRKILSWRNGLARLPDTQKVAGCLMASDVAT